MKLFESRNVLDRIETTWNIFFSSAWQVRVLPQILLVAIWTTLGILSCTPLFLLFSDFMNWDRLDNVDQMLLIVKTLTILLLPITIFTLVHGMVYTYTLTISHEYEVGKTWQQYARTAWSRLWWWAWYGLWTTAFMLIIYTIWITLYFLSSSLIFGFALIILICIFIWWIVALYALAPGFILENSWGPRSVFSLLSLTSARWWRVCGNIFLGNIVVGSMLSLIQQLISWISWWGMLWLWLGLKLGSIEGQENIDWSILFSDMPEIGIWFVIGTIILYIIWGTQRVFINMFQYTLWREIITDSTEPDIKKAE